MLANWWVWVAGGLALGILELFAPGYLFVGFAVGGVVTGAVIGLGLPGAASLAASPALALTVFGLVSLAVWLGLRRLVGVRNGQVRRIEHDIND